MKPHLLAQLIGVSPMTLRRWSRIYDTHLTPQATPERGESRSYQERDQRVFLLVKSLRDGDVSPDAIKERLDYEKAHDYANLPEIPDAWRGQPEETIPLALAGARAGELATIAALQTQVQHLLGRLDEATQRVEQLETELHTVRTGKNASDSRVSALELALAEAQGDVKQATASLEAFRLAYSFGRDKPVNIGVIIVAALAVGAALMVIAFILAVLIA